MKKIVFFIVVILFGVKITKAQTFSWAKKWGSGGTDQGYSSATDASGNVYTAGAFFGPMDIDPGPGTFTVANNGLYDIYVSKLDVSGNFIWGFSIGGIDDDRAYSITVDASGNIYITGYFGSTFDFDPGMTWFNLTATGTSFDFFVAKYDSNGGFLWAKSTGSAGWDMGHSISTDLAGNVYTTGEFDGTVDFDPGPGTFTLVNSSGWDDSYIQKLDASGNFIWALSFLGLSSGGGAGLSVKLDPLGNIYTTGEFVGTVDFDPGVGTYTLTSNNNQPDVFVSKLDPSGNLIWAKQLVGIGIDTTDAGNSLCFDAAGNLYITGYFGKTVDFDPGPSTYTLSSGGYSDIFIMKLDPSGNFVWANSIGGAGQYDIGKSITLDASGNVFAAGYFQSVADFDPGPSVYTVAPVGSSDIYVAKYTSSGNFISMYSLGGIWDDYCNSIQMDIYGSVIITGNFSQTIDFNPGPGTYTMTAAGFDTYVQKMCSGSIAPSPSNTTPLSNQTVCSGKFTTLNATGMGALFWYNTPTGGSSLATGSSFITPTLATNTTYYVQDSTCSGSIRIPITLTVIPSPTIGISTSAYTVCNGATTTLTASGALTYTWSSSLGTNTIVTVNPTVTTTYTLTGTAANGCSDKKTITLVASNLNLGVLTGTNGVTLISQQFTGTHQWINCSTNSPISGAFNFTYTATANGSYAVIVGNCCCVDTSACVNIIAAKVEEFSGSNELEIFPNPADNYLLIVNQVLVIDVMMMDATGKEVYHKKGESKNLKINTFDLPEGIYFVKISDINDRIVYKKVVINH